MEYLDGCNTAMKICYEKGGYHGRYACIIEVENAVSLQRCILQINGLGI